MDKNTFNYYIIDNIDKLIDILLEQTNWHSDLVNWKANYIRWKKIDSSNTVSYEESSRNRSKLIMSLQGIYARLFNEISVSDKTNISSKNTIAVPERVVVVEVVLQNLRKNASQYVGSEFMSQLQSLIMDCTQYLLNYTNNVAHDRHETESTALYNRAVQLAIDKGAKEKEKKKVLLDLATETLKWVSTSEDIISFQTLETVASNVLVIDEDNTTVRELYNNMALYERQPNMRSNLASKFKKELEKFINS